MHSEDALPLLTLNFFPYCPSEPITTLTWQSSGARIAFQSWIDANKSQIPSSPTSLPTEASVRIFTLLHQHRTRKSSLNIILTPSPTICTVQIFLKRPKPLHSISRELVRPSEALRILFWHYLQRHTSPPSPRDTCGFAGCASSCKPHIDNDTRQAFHLDRVFDACSLPPAAANSPRKYRKSLLTDLPNEILLNIVLRLEPHDFANLASTSPALAALLVPIVPGLRLHLFPHQVRALDKMMALEHPKAPSRPVPLLETLPLADSSFPNVAVDMCDGSVLQFVDLPRVPDPVGGLFCDEPGLGKTITALSLILKTLGQLPRPPPGQKLEIIGSGATACRVYKEQTNGRFRRYGDDAKISISRRSRLLPDSVKDRRRSSYRSVIQPNFYQTSKGEGSVPNLEPSATNSVIYLSRATLVIAPQVLTAHWLNQIALHVEHGKLDILHLRTERDLPYDVEDLSNGYDLIITSFELISAMDSTMRRVAPMLLRVHFLRVIIDEGHALSASGITQFSFVSDLIRTDRRWVMTGTPTPSTQRSDIDHLVSLLRFIREESYGLDKQAWSMGIRTPYSSFMPESLDRLKELLSRVMIRSKKSMLTAKCHVKNVLLDFSEDSARSYNELFSLIRRNLITSDWFSATNSESLLNKKNKTEANRVLANLRLSCCMGGTVKAEFTRSEVVEMLDILYDTYRDFAGLSDSDRFDDPELEWHLLESPTSDDDELDDAALAELRNRVQMFEVMNEQDEPHLRLTKYFKKPINGKSFLKRIYRGKLCTIGEAFFHRHFFCQKCGGSSTVPMVTPCAHLLCNDCISKDRTACVATGCGKKYYLDKVGVPEKLIELQPSISADGWIPHWEFTKSSKMEYLMNRILSIPMNEEWVNGESKPRLTRPKIIIYSHFQEHLELLSMTLRKREMEGRFTELYVNQKEWANRGMKRGEIVNRAIKQFTEDPEIHILIMNTKYGSVGLDFSFVEYMFMLEPLWDASLELQVISRAHRIGCKKDIYVERLIMKNSLEVDMLSSLSNSSESQSSPRTSGVAHAKSQQETSRISRLLSSLKMVQAKKTNEELIREATKRKRLVDGDTTRRVRFRVE